MFTHLGQKTPSVPVEVSYSLENRPRKLRAGWVPVKDVESFQKLHDLQPHQMIADQYLVKPRAVLGYTKNLSRDCNVDSRIGGLLIEQRSVSECSQQH